MRASTFTAIFLCIVSININAQKIGFVSVNLMEVILSNDTIVVTDDKGVYARIGKNFIFNGSEFDIKEHNTKELQSLFKMYVFEPDYDLLIFECIDTTCNDYIVKVNDVLKYIAKDQKYIKFETIKQHLLNNFIALNKENPLREGPCEDSSIITDYYNYSYLPLEIKGDWLKLRCFLECEGCPDGKIIEGWVKWMDCNGNLLVRIFYAC